MSAVLKIKVSSTPTHPVFRTLLRRRDQLQGLIRELENAHKQGRALGMAFAAKQMVLRAKEFGTQLRKLHAHNSYTQARSGFGRSLALAKRRTLVSEWYATAVRESQALRGSSRELFESCLRRKIDEPSQTGLMGRSPVEVYSWLRRDLEGSAMMIDRALTPPDDVLRNMQPRSEGVP